MNNIRAEYQVDQVVTMNDETKRYSQSVDVEVVERNDIYMRYVEQLEEHALDVTLRVGDGFVKIQRRGIINMNFHFVEDEMTDTFYESPAGKHHLQIRTNSLEIGEQSIEIHYELHDSEDKLGDYHYKIMKVG